MEPTTGIEPVNLFLTKEALYRLSYVGALFGFSPERSKKTDYNVFIFQTTAFNIQCGAGDETRTRDIQLGRLELYQLSYSRLKTLMTTGKKFFNYDDYYKFPQKV